MSFILILRFIIAGIILIFDCHARDAYGNYIRPFSGYLCAIRSIIDSKLFTVFPKSTRKWWGLWTQRIACYLIRHKLFYLHSFHLPCQIKVWVLLEAKCTVGYNMAAFHFKGAFVIVSIFLEWIKTWAKECWNRNKCNNLCTLSLEESNQQMIKKLNTSETPAPTKKIHANSRSHGRRNTSSWGLTLRKTKCSASFGPNPEDLTAARAVLHWSQECEGLA